MFADNNNLRGTIPSEIMQVKHLKELFLGKVTNFYDFFAYISSHLCLILDLNELTGPIPNFRNGSKLEIISAGRFSFGCIFVVQSDVYL